MKTRDCQQMGNAISLVELFHFFIKAAFLPQYHGFHYAALLFVKGLLINMFHAFSKTGQAFPNRCRMYLQNLRLLRINGAVNSLSFIIQAAVKLPRIGWCFNWINGSRKGKIRAHRIFGFIGQIHQNVWCFYGICIILNQAVCQIQL